MPNNDLPLHESTEDFRKRPPLDQLRIILRAHMAEGSDDSYAQDLVDQIEREASPYHDDRNWHALGREQAIASGWHPTAERIVQLESKLRDCEIAADARAARIAELERKVQEQQVVIADKNEHIAELQEARKPASAAPASWNFEQRLCNANRDLRKANARIEDLEKRIPEKDALIIHLSKKAEDQKRAMENCAAMLGVHKSQEPL